MVALLGVASPSARATLIQLINGSVTNVVFSDNFEGGTLGAGPNGGAPGSWSGLSGGFVAVSNAAPFAAQGTKYLAISRNTGVGTPGPSAGFAGVVNATSGIIEARFSFYLPSSAINSTAEIGLSSVAGAAGYNGSLAWLEIPDTSGHLSWNDSVLTHPITNASGTAVMDPLRDRWQTWTLDYNIVNGANNDFYTITVDGITSVHIPATSAGNGTHDGANTSLAFLIFRGGNTGDFFVDAIVPEPSTIVLMLAGALTLWRRHRPTPA